MFVFINYKMINGPRPKPSGPWRSRTRGPQLSVRRVIRRNTASDSYERCFNDSWTVLEGS